MTGSSIKVWLLLTCLLATIYGSFVVWRRERLQKVIAATTTVSRADGDAKPAAPLEDFVLTDQDGNEFDSASLRGKVWVGSFFFTNCPAVCWRLNQTLAAVQETSPSSDTRFISITCDPDNDTPAVLAKYAQHFKADPQRWTFLTGDMNLIRRIGNEFFQVAVENETHSDRAFVVDRSGQVRGRFRLTQPDQVEMLKELLTAVEAEPFVESELPVDVEPPATTSTAPADEPNGDQDRDPAEDEPVDGV
jgi:cytochrome oxidase Cu insertion factor (SCO1/SenC/PrrC family)